MKTWTLLCLAFLFNTSAVTVDFNHSLKSSAGVERIWEEFQLAMFYSDDSSIWPSNSFIRGEGLEVCSIIEMT